MKTRRLLTISHSYVVALNRRLAHELTREGTGRWEVVAVAPKFMHGDLRPIPLEAHPDEPNRLIPVTTHFSFKPHILLYGSTLMSALRESWDLVHCWEEPYVLAATQVAGLTPRRVPIVFSSYQNINKQYPPPFAQMERFAIGRAAGWISGGKTISAALDDRPGYDQKPSVQIPMGVDIEHFQPDPEARRTIRRRLNWDEDGSPVIGYLGRFVEEKGIDLLLEALEGVSTPHRLLFVGSGSLEGKIQDWAARHRREVRIVKGVTHTEVPAYLNAMDILCAPSQTTPKWREQFGRMLVEAFACGLTVVGSDSGEIPFTMGQAGVILPEANVWAWTESLEALLLDPHQRAEFGARGRERAVTQFSWPVVARKHLDFFAQLTAEE